MSDSWGFCACLGLAVLHWTQYKSNPHRTERICENTCHKNTHKFVCKYIFSGEYWIFIETEGTVFPHCQSFFINREHPSENSINLYCVPAYFDLKETVYLTVSLGKYGKFSGESGHFLSNYYYFFFNWVCVIQSFCFNSLSSSPFQLGKLCRCIQ